MRGETSLGTERVVECVADCIGAFKEYPRLWELLERESVRSGSGRTFVVAVGKAALSMSRVASGKLGSIDGAVIVVPEGYLETWQWPVPFGAATTALESTHPIPGTASCASAEAIEILLAKTRPEDRVLALISGGGSSLIGCPIAGLELSAYVESLRRLYRSGRSIAEVNAVRGGVSRLASGGLAELAAPAVVRAFVLSDVPGNDASIVASGPTAIPDAHQTARLVAAVSDQFGDDIGALASYRLAQLRMSGINAQTTLVGTNEDLMASLAERLGREGLVVRGRLTLPDGEARVVGADLGRTAIETLEPGEALVFGGEVTVKVAGDGSGGRSQELVLSSGLALQSAGVQAIVVSIGSDGLDGPTDAAGAALKVSQTSPLDVARARVALARNDTYPFLDEMGALVRMGPTHTNVMDVGAIVMGPNP